MEMAERKKLAAGIALAQATTLALARSGRLSSEMTLVSSRNSAEVGRLEESPGDARWLEGKSAIAGLGERFGEAHTTARETPIVLDRQKHMRRMGRVRLGDLTRFSASASRGSTALPPPEQPLEEPVVDAVAAIGLPRRACRPADRCRRNRATARRITARRVTARRQHGGEREAAGVDLRQAGDRHALMRGLHEMRPDLHRQAAA